MPEFSTIVRQRLQAGEERKGLHPDADTLTAYVEQLLPGHERDYVARHLSLCAECRDVVTLTMPEVTAAAEVQEVAIPAAQAEPAVVPMPAPPRRSWFLTPAFGMAASIAAMALGLVLVLRLDHGTQVATIQHATQNTEARNSVPAATEDKVTVPEQPASRPGEPAASFAPSAPPPPNASVQPAPSASIAANRADIAPNTTRAVASKPKIAAGLTGSANRPTAVADLRQDYLNSQLIFANAGANEARSGQELPQAPQPVFSTNLRAPSLLGGSTVPPQNNAYLQIPSNTGQSTLSFYPTPQQQGSSVLDKIVDAGKLPLRAKKLVPPIRARETDRLSMFSPGLGLADSSQASAMAKAPDNTDSKSELAQSQAFTRRALTPAAVARLDEPMVQWKVAQGKLLKSTDLSSWVEAYPSSDGIQFTVVSGNGAEIWAGGNKAALVHSRDAGATWDKVRMGVAANGDIMAIEGGGLTLQVKTSTGQTWVTSDGGASWTLR